MEFLKPLFNEDINSEGEVQILESKFERSQILSVLDPQLYDLSFNEWIEDRKLIYLDKADEILSLFDNSSRFNQLKKCYLNGTLIPFVGAGMSIPSGYPGWGEFLYELSEESHVEKQKLDDLFELGKYEEAAQLIYDDLGKALFNEYLENKYVEENTVNGPLQYLPELFQDKTIITTNFDKLIENIYKSQHQSFDSILSGRALEEAMKKISSDNSLLLKLHGDCDLESNRILTKDEYNQAYSDKKLVNIFFNRILLSRSLLFLGCSLSQDRTIKSMLEIVNNQGSSTLPRHYALLEDKEGVDRIARKKELSKANIFPIWYPENEHDESVEALFLKLMEVAT
ncbi:MAG: SIR2 family protein [Candidatus Muiribacteriota bacterium]